MVKNRILIWTTLVAAIIGIAALLTALVLWCVGFMWPPVEMYNQRDMWHSIAGTLFLYGFFTTPAAVFATLYQQGMLNKKKPAGDQ
jgi:hypothetical protein